jgi:hypothetical protein
MDGINRRDFFRRSAGAVAAATLASQLASPMTLEARAREFYQPRSAGQAVRGINNFEYNPTQATGSDLVDEQIAYAINMYVPRKFDYKWGFRGQLLGMGSVSRGCSGGPKGNYMFTMQNEYRNQNDPIRMLTSAITLGNRPQISVQRVDHLSALVDSEHDDNFMEWVLKRPDGREVPDLKINNLRRINRDGTFNNQAKTEFTYDNAGDLGIRLDQMRDVTPYHGDMQLFHRSLRFVGDPFSIHTGRMTRDGIDGHGVYEVVGYRIEPDHSRGPIMTGEIEMVNAPRSQNGFLTRNDERTLLMNNMDFYNEIELVYFLPGNAQGWYQGTVNEFKIANKANEPWSKRSEFYRPKLHLDNERRHWI